MSCNTLLLVSVVLALVLFCGLSAYLLCQMLREWAFPREIGATFRGLAKTTIAVLALGAAVAVLQGGAKSRAPARHAPMVQSAPGDDGESSGRTGDPDDGDEAAITSIAVTNGVEMVFHRPFSSSADAVEVVVCAATNLVSTNWFPVATAVFAAGETDVPVALSPARLSGFGISGFCFLRFLESGDPDGDGLETWYERLVVRTDPHCADSDRDGLPDGDEIGCGLDPLDPYSAGSPHSDGFARFLSGHDPSDIVPGEMFPRHQAYLYPTNSAGELVLPASTADAAVLRLEVAGTGAADLLVDGVPYPLVVSEDWDVPVLVRVPRGRVVSLSLRASPRATAVPAVSFGSDGFAYGSLPSTCGSDGWIVFPRTDLTPVCIHGIGHARTVEYSPGVEDPDLASVWTDGGCSGLVFEDVRPRAVDLRAFSRGPSGSVGCTLSHPLQLFGPRLIETPVRTCPRPEGLPDPGDCPWFDPSVGGSGDYVDPPRCPCGCGCEADRCACGCLGEDSDGPCSCRSWGGSAGSPGPDDPIESPDDPRAADLSPLPDVLYLHRGYERRLRVDVPAGRMERCSCPCPEHALHHVSVLGDERLRVAGPDGSACYELYTTAVVRVSGLSPSVMVGDAPLVFSLDGEPYEAHAFTVLGLDITHPNLDLDELDRVDSSFGVPMVVTEDPEAGLSLNLRTDVHIAFGTVRLALEAESGRFQLHSSPEGFRPREVLLDSWTDPEVRMPIPDWWVFAGMDWSFDDPDFPVVVTASEPGTCRLVFSYYGVVGDRYVMCTKTRRITAVAPPLLADHDRNGGIDGADAALQAAGAAFRFWCNEDVDKGDFVGQNPDVSPNWDADPALARVKGRLDLVNLFPVRIDVSAFRRAWGGAATFRLRRESPFDRLRYCRLAGVSPDRADAIQTEEVLTASGGPLETAALHPLDPAGEEIGEWLDEDGRAMLAIMAGGYVDEWSCPELVVELGGRVVLACRLPLSISSVDAMYRYADLRPAAEDPSFTPAVPPEPWNRPDDGTDGRHFVFVHGYNVNASQSRSWARAMFKRLWWAGSKSRFTAVDWRGDYSQVADLVAPNYHQNVVHAFRTAPALKTLCDQLPGEKVMLAHSLGNMLTCEAIALHGLQYSKYYMLNAAVPIEAFDAGALAQDNMKPLAWQRYSDALFANNWYRNFSVDDGRSGLTWRGIFAGVHDAVNCYSPTEDVLGNAPAVGAGGAWSAQELLKGTGTMYLLPRVRREGGWGFNPDHTVPLSQNGELLKTEYTDEEMVTSPPFLPFAEEWLHATNAVTAAQVAAVRDRILADGIPAQTFAAGANPVGVFGDAGNYNYQSATPNGWPRKNGDVAVWEHSDIKNVAYYYVHVLFEKIKDLR